MPERPPTRRVTDQDVYAVVRRIPKGRVTTYGRIAKALALPDARRIGYALARLDDGSDVPWHRVVNASGGISERSDGSWGQLQRVRLEAEGVRFGRVGRIELGRYGWVPRRRR